MTDAVENSLIPDLPEASTPYQVLARKYRPQKFDDLVGQGALVRTLTNAIQNDRVAHAFMLTGVRGVGKTTTARIIAKALNCTGTDGKGGPTPNPCGSCDNCKSITQDRHVDVLEMDAASHTGVDDIREITDGARYSPVSARTKIYIIDEIHMLSKAAFNALLKILEEPPAHVKFIFATTEIRKVPVTILSRCQRFDLPRIGKAELIPLFEKILKLETVEIEDEALQLIARAADGSARDGLSLLDQAIAMAEETVKTDDVRSMLGLADRIQIFDLLDATFAGKSDDMLSTSQNLFKHGADPVHVLQDLMSLVHTITRIKTLKDPKHTDLPEAELTRGQTMAENLSHGQLHRVWQMLLKGSQELQTAPDPHQALEMILLRVSHAGTLPTPGELAKKLDQAPSNAPVAANHSATPNGGGSNVASASYHVSTGENTVRQTDTAPVASVDTQIDVRNIQDVVVLCEQQREGMLVFHLRNNVHIVKFKPHHIEVRLTDHASKSLCSDLSRFLQDQTGQRWLISQSNDMGQPTLAEQEAAFEAAALEEMSKHPSIAKILSVFPGSEVRKIVPTSSTLTED